MKKEKVAKIIGNRVQKKSCSYVFLCVCVPQKGEAYKGVEVEERK
jgi:hypothetical protein